MEGLGPWLLEQDWRIAAFAVLLGWFLWLFWDICANERDRGRWVLLLRQAAGHRRYNRLLRRALARMDRALSAPEHRAHTAPRRRAWSQRLASIALLAAVAYPLLAVTGQWLAGSELVFNDTPVLPKGTPTARLFMACVLGSSVLLIIAGLRSRVRPAMFMTGLAIVVLLGCVIFSERFGVPRNAASAVPVAAAFAFTATTVSTFATAIAITTTFAALAALGVTAVVAVATAFAATTVVAITAPFATERLERRGRPSALPTLALPLLSLAALTATIRLSPQDTTPETQAYFVLFLGLLPALNALADFASIGLTRFLLRRSLDGRRLSRALWDGALGTAIFLALGFALIAWLHLVRFNDGMPLLDLTQFFDRLWAAPGDHWWLGIMLITTLLPTLLHLSLVTFATLLFWPAPARQLGLWLLNEGGKGSTQMARLAGLYLALLATLSVWGILVLGHALATADHSLALRTLIAAFRGFACMIGAVPPLPSGTCLGWPG